MKLLKKALTTSQWTMLARRRPCSTLSISSVIRWSRRPSSRKADGGRTVVPPFTLLIDGNPLVYSSSAACPSLVKSDGSPIGGVHLFLMRLVQTVAQLRPEFVTVAFDRRKKGPHRPHREIVIPEYKANRPPTPQPVISQLLLAQQGAAALGIQVTRPPEGYEADDILAMYAIKAWRQGHRVGIISPDKDMYQLVRNDGHNNGPGSIAMYDIKTKQFIYESEVQEAFGVKPQQIPHMLALMGDKADNVPGVPRIGKKTAAQLLRVHGSIHTLLDATSDDTHSQRAREYRDRVLNNFSVVNLLDIPTLEGTVPLKDLKSRQPVQETLDSFLQEHELKQVAKTIEKVGFARRMNAVNST